MALREFSPLIQALTVSVALHAGAFAALDTAWGGSAGKRMAPGRHALLYVSLPGSPPDQLQSKSTASISFSTDTAETPRSARPPGLIDLPMPHYFSARDLDRKPEVIGEVPLAYPAELPVVTHNRVVLSLLIDEQGRVDKVVVENTEAHEAFEEFASRAFAGARFRPGMRAGEAVKSRMRIEVTFEGE